MKKNRQIKSKKEQNIFTALFSLIILLYPIALSAQLDLTASQQDNLSASQIGMPFPNFTTRTLNGKSISAKQLMGKITVINFWYRSCAPCMREMDALNNLYYKFKDNPSFQFLSFTFDSKEDAQATVEKYNIPYDVFSVTQEETSRLNGNNKYPMTIIVDQTGRIAFMKSGGAIVKEKATIEVQKMELLIAFLLAQKDSKNDCIYSVSAIQADNQNSIISENEKQLSLLWAYLRERDSITQSKVGTAYPNFQVTSLDGKIVSEKQLKGKVTIINFWFEACAPCMAEMDALNGLYHKFKGNPSFQFLSFTSDPPQNVRKTAEKFHLLYDIFPINKEECSRLNYNNAFPTTVIVNQSGDVAFVTSGNYTDERVTLIVGEFEEKISALLEK